MLLVGAALFICSFLKLQDAYAGFETARLMTMRFYMPGDQYESPDSMVRRVDEVVRRVETLPGVVVASASNMVPFSGGGSEGAVLPEGQVFEAGKEPTSSWFGVTPHMLKALNILIVSGRDFTDNEEQGWSGVAVLNGVFAKRTVEVRTCAQSHSCARMMVVCWNSWLTRADGHRVNEVPLC